MTLRSYIYTRNVINAILALITFFLGLRIVFRFVGANSATPFVDLIYSFSNALMAPFRGITSNLFFGAGTLDIVAMVSLAIYLLLGYLIISICKSTVKPDRVVVDRPTPVTHYHEVPVRRRRRIF